MAKTKRTAPQRQRTSDDDGRLSRRTFVSGAAAIAGTALVTTGCDDESEVAPGPTGTGGQGGGTATGSGSGGSGGAVGSGGGGGAGGGGVGPRDLTNHVLVARNGTPEENVLAVLAAAGGIERFIDIDDVVVLNPNGQWPRQGYTNTACMKALIDAILARPGGFDGEVIIAEHVHRSPSEALNGNYCWNISAGANRENNWPDMSYFELVQHYHDNGHPNVTANPLYDSSQSPDWSPVAGPSEVAAGEQGWVRNTYTTQSTGGIVRLAHPILRSSYSDALIDLHDGVWEGGGYSGRAVKLIFLPTLNNHSSFNNEDYAGPTSAVKCHLGIVEFAGTEGVHLHDIGYGNGHPEAVGESVGHLITQILHPSFYLTCAEYTGHRGRTATEATHTRTVGLCLEPVTLDYWMCKYVMYPIATSQDFMNPDNDNNLRKQLQGCHDKGVGTMVEADMTIEEQDLA
ncbi:MAG: hypothetical protein JRI23_05415 [Deltaproteobacteria bacterium]|jgi:hypothetical protein|nr:hypothetical protein [Deltaproteobacteria bacterium]MBW2530991.1 hypothetical protein [Deltaproteobacteria bacterium]